VQRRKTLAIVAATVVTATTAAGLAAGANRADALPIQDLGFVRGLAHLLERPGALAGMRDVFEGGLHVRPRPVSLPPFMRRSRERVVKALKDEELNEAACLTLEGIGTLFSDDPFEEALKHFDDEAQAEDFAENLTDLSDGDIQTLPDIYCAVRDYGGW
jgi:hypothetical protein